MLLFQFFLMLCLTPGSKSVAKEIVQSGYGNKKQIQWKRISIYQSSLFVISVWAIAFLVSIWNDAFWNASRYAIFLYKELWAGAANIMSAFIHNACCEIFSSKYFCTWLFPWQGQKKRKGSRPWCFLNGIVVFPTLWYNQEPYQRCSLQLLQKLTMILFLADSSLTLRKSISCCPTAPEFIGFFT